MIGYKTSAYCIPLYIGYPCNQAFNFVFKLLRFLSTSSIATADGWSQTHLVPSDKKGNHWRNSVLLVSLVAGLGSKIKNAAGVSGFNKILNDQTTNFRGDKWGTPLLIGRISVERTIRELAGKNRRSPTYPITAVQKCRITF